MELLYLFVGFCSGFLFSFIWEFVTMNILKTGKYAYVGGFHFHHSLFGLVAFLLTLVYKNDYVKVVFFIGFGVGVITQHTITDRLVFISRDSDTS